MIRAILVAFLCVTGLVAQQPLPQWSFAEATVIKIDSSRPYYEYTIETAVEGYVVRSPIRIVITEGAHVKVAIVREYVYITDANGKTQQTTGVLRYRLPPPSPPKKYAPVV
jgi:hypothetical protein